MEVLEDRTVLSPYVVTTTANTGAGSLRDAIAQVNADTSHTLYASSGNPSVDEIDFNITAASDTGGGFNSATGVATITPPTDLPSITNAVLIEGYSQAGASPNTLTVGDNAVLKIQLNLQASSSVLNWGLRVDASNTTIRGLVLNNAPPTFGYAIYVTGTSDQIVGSFIGTNPTGTQAVGTLSVGIKVDGAPNLLIGGTTATARNIISGNSYGIQGSGTGIQIQGNYIGTDVTGTRAIGNSQGINVGGTCTVGGTFSGTGNLISGNQTGIYGDELVEGNLIGTDATGTSALGNGTGIVVGSGAVVGGTTPAARNIISGNGYGIFDNGGPGALIEGNYIGSDITGTQGVGTAQAAGIYLYGAGATVGGLTATPGTGAGNLILGNNIGIGALSGGSGYVVEGNLIQGNTYGVYLTAGTTNSTIGGTVQGEGNVIVFNGIGVLVDSGPQPNSSTGHAILGNSIHDNGGGGIVLSNVANHNQAFPVFTSATSSASGTTVSGTLQSVASTTFRIEFFANTTADQSSPYGQGRTFLGSVNVATDSTGYAPISFTLTSPLPTGQTILSATATKLTTSLTPIETSQFSLDVSIPSVGPITAPLAPVAVNTAVNASASFTDALTTTTHTALWDWGDNTTSAGSVTESNGSGTVTGSHTYTVDGVYTVKLTVTNHGVGSGQGSGQAVFQYVVVYNASAGFVTGGGWFNSPAGAYAANTSLTGQANFGLNARYHNGDTVPTGNTDFRFPAANLTFQSSYDWLVITTSQAQYQGSGTINGAGNYGFLVTALDNGGGSTADKLRIKIWDKNNNNAVVYDSQPNAAATASPTTSLGGGRIQVHTNAQLVAGGENPSKENVEPLTSEELQPVVQQAIALWAAAGIDPAQVSALSHVAVGIADLPGPWLGMAFPGAIWIDQDAAGYGWYLDASPSASGSVPAGRVDLLTVVAHELGHELGFEDTDDGSLMDAFLPTGVRRLPAAVIPPSQLAPAPTVSVAPSAVGSPVTLSGLDAWESTVVTLLGSPPPAVLLSAVPASATPLQKPMAEVGLPAASTPVLVDAVWLTEPKAARPQGERDAVADQLFGDTNDWLAGERSGV
jgi:hypothetical protein